MATSTSTPRGRLGQRALDRLREAELSQSAVVLVVAFLVVARITTFVLQLVFEAADDEPALHVVQLIVGVLSTLVDVVILFVVLLLFDAIRRIDRESDRIQTFMDSVYRRKL